MKLKLRKLLDKTLCILVKRETGLPIEYNDKTMMVTIGKKDPFKLTKEYRVYLTSLMGL